MTAPLLTVPELREHVETALSDEALTDLIEKNDLVVLEWAGPFGWDEYEDLPTEVTQSVYAGGLTLAPLRQVPGEIVSVTEFYGGSGAGVAIDPTGFTARGNSLERAGGATWGYRLTVVYVPANSRALRIMALVDLCKLDINHDPGTQSESAGPWSQTQADYRAEKDRILRTLWEPEPFA